MRKTLSTLITAAAGLFMLSAHAESPTIASDTFASSATRAQVQAELADFRQSGANPWSTSYNPLRGHVSSKTRQQVIGEFIAEREQVARMNAEDSGSQLLSQAAKPMRVTPLVAQGR